MAIALGTQGMWPDDRPLWRKLLGVLLTLAFCAGVLVLCLLAFNALLNSTVKPIPGVP